MAHYRASLHVPMAQEEVFAYLSDFSTTQEWDPGVERASRLDDGPVRLGSQFRLLAGFLGRSVPLTYAVVEYDPPVAVAFLGENSTVTSRDRITFEGAGEHTWIAYEADLALKGLLRVGDPLLRIAFKRVGDRALGGLRERLRGPSPAGLPPLGSPQLSADVPG